MRFLAERVGRLPGTYSHSWMEGEKECECEANNPMQIGKTSSLVLTLCGVLKDIMLVIASMMIWGTQVTALQFFGYSIALGGMVYYRLGYDTLKTYAGEAGRQWAELGNTRPVLRRVAIVTLVLLVVFVLLGGLAPTYAPEYDPTKYLSEVSSKFGVTNV